MSSMIRTMQKRIMKNRLGYQRETQRLTTGLDGMPKIVPYKRGTGPIVNAEGDRVSLSGSSYYPPHLPHKITRATV